MKIELKKRKDKQKNYMHYMHYIFFASSQLFQYYQTSASFCIIVSKHANTTLSKIAWRYSNKNQQEDTNKREKYRKMTLKFDFLLTIHHIF